MYNVGWLGIGILYVRRDGVSRKKEAEHFFKKRKHAYELIRMGWRDSGNEHFCTERKTDRHGGSLLIFYQSYTTLCTVSIPIEIVFVHTLRIIFL
jgi:hypothetical protein